MQKLLVFLTLIPALSNSMQISRAFSYKSEDGKRIRVLQMLKSKNFIVEIENTEYDIPHSNIRVLSDRTLFFKTEVGILKLSSNRETAKLDKQTFYRQLQDEGYIGKNKNNQISYFNIAK